MIAILLTIAVVYLLIGDFTFTYTNKQTKTVSTFRFNGALWVALDAHTICKYNSGDTCMKMVSFNVSRTK